MAEGRRWGAPTAARKGLVAPFALVGWIFLCLVGGCASPSGPHAEDGFYLDSELGYRIGRPGGGSGWELFHVEGADLAFRQAAPEPGHGPAMMVQISECGRGSDNLSVVGRQLLIGIRERALRQSAPVALRGSPGWMQVFDTTHEDVPVRVKTISIRSDGCTFDWALVAPGPFRAAEDQFDAWWSSFERLPKPSTDPSMDLSTDLSTDSTGGRVLQFAVVPTATPRAEP